MLNSAEMMISLLINKNTTTMACSYLLAEKNSCSAELSIKKFHKLGAKAVFRNAVIANVLPSIPVPNDERKQEQESRAKHSQVTCTSKLSPGIFPAVLQERCSCVFLFAFMHISPAPVMTLLLNRNNLGSKLCVCLYI